MVSLIVVDVGWWLLNWIEYASKIIGARKERTC